MIARYDAPVNFVHTKNIMLSCLPTNIRARSVKERRKPSFKTESLHWARKDPQIQVALGVNSRA